MPGLKYLSKQVEALKSVNTGEDTTPTTYDVFLGGTICYKNREDDWRHNLIKSFKPDVTYYDPYVDNWTEEKIAEENIAKENSYFKLYVITPQMKGSYSIAELMHDSIIYGDRTIVCILSDYKGKTFTNGQVRSLNAVLNLCRKYNANVLYTLEGVSVFINNEIRRCYRKWQ